MSVLYSTLIHLPPLRFTVSEDAGIEPRKVAISALAVRRSSHSATSHPQFNYISSTIGYISSTLGYISSTLGYISSTLGYISSTLGYISSTLGYISSTLDSMFSQNSRKSAQTNHPQRLLNDV
jgi:hypothetical protein